MCQALTNHFDLDKETKIIRCNARRASRKGYRRKVVLISESKSNWTNTWKEEVQDNVNFRTEFFLYRSEKEYLLQVKGVSGRPADFPAKYKVILFAEPEELMTIVEDSANRDIYLSDPVLELLENLQSSEYITTWEKAKWDDVLIDSEE